MNTIQTLVSISGNTYPVKDQLKSLGARWNGADKCWMVTPDKAEQAKALVAGAGRYGSYSTIGQRQASRMSRTGWTGCSCGSIEGNPRSSDCSQCQHDY